MVLLEDKLSRVAVGLVVGVVSLCLGLGGAVVSADEAASEQPSIYAHPNGSIIITTTTTTADTGASAGPIPPVLVNGVDIVSELTGQASLLAGVQSHFCSLALPSLEIPTNSAHAMEFFTINGVQYLAIANERYPVTSTLPSQILRWNGDGPGFEVIATVTTHLVIDFEYFTTGGEHYLVAVSNGRITPSVDYVTDSIVLMWNQASEQFTEHQRIGTIGAIAATAFTPLGEEAPYLAFAFFTDNESQKELNSTIHKWDPVQQMFELHQTVVTMGATTVKHFTLEGEDFLAVGNSVSDGPSSLRPPSELFKWNSTQGAFESYQHIASTWATGFAFYEIDGEAFLAVSNYRGSGIQPQSTVYFWNATSKTFRFRQTLRINAASGVDFFTIEGRHFLAISIELDRSSQFNTDSHVFEWNAKSGLFDLVEDIPTRGSKDVRHVVIGNNHYLAFANSFEGGGAGTLTTSSIFPWNGCRFYTPPAESGG